jgi:glutamate synthase (NADPH/NADH) large chain
VAYVWDKDQDLALKCNLGMVELDPVEFDDDLAELLEMIELHRRYTGSTVAAQVLDRWPQIARDEFVKVMPTDYKRVLLERQKHDEELESTVHAETT